MKASFLQSMAWLHTWGGLIFGWLLFPICFSGTLALFSPEITHWMRPEVKEIALRGADAASVAETFLKEHAPQAQSWTVTLPQRRSPVLEVSWFDGGSEAVRYLSEDGKAFEVRDTEGGEFIAEFHASFHGGNFGLFLVAAAGMAMLAAIVSGIVIHRRIFVDMFLFRRSATSHRAWLDAHNVFGVFTLPFQIMIAYTGVLLFYSVTMPAGIDVRYGGASQNYFSELFPQPKSLKNVGTILPLAGFVTSSEEMLGSGGAARIVVDRKSDSSSVSVFRRSDDRIVMISDMVKFDGSSGSVLAVVDNHSAAFRIFGAMGGLHYARFGGSAMTWIYFFCGIAGCVLILTGLVVFVEKRKQRAVGHRILFHAAERLNIGATAGILLAIGAYFWANRILPLNLEERAHAEIAIFFACWLAAVVHALMRPPIYGWQEQLLAAALMFVALPVMDVLDGRWSDMPRLGVSIAFVVFGCSLAVVAGKYVARSAVPRPAASN